MVIFPTVPLSHCPTNNLAKAGPQDYGSRLALSGVFGIEISTKNQE
jgi:hypothetical protein